MNIEYYISVHGSLGGNRPILEYTASVWAEFGTPWMVDFYPVLIPVGCHSLSQLGSES